MTLFYFFAFRKKWRWELRGKLAKPWCEGTKRVRKHEEFSQIFPWVFVVFIGVFSIYSSKMMSLSVWRGPELKLSSRILWILRVYSVHILRISPMVSYFPWSPSPNINVLNKYPNLSYYFANFAFRVIRLELIPILFRVRRSTANGLIRRFSNMIKPSAMCLRKCIWSLGRCLVDCVVAALLLHSI